MRHKVTAVVSGTVWMLSVGVGQKVFAGSQLMVLECMKMEIPVEAPADGTVVELAESGRSITEGDVVAVIED